VFLEMGNTMFIKNFEQKSPEIERVDTNMGTKH
jgi:hypothetical protein